ncbi:ADP-ribosylglycohydrolase family protein [Bifidobacterium choloepi]|uniref:ADP-ribosylglycohydrolase n=1 Tax=Bifidobacterium choloepi TaxID=2614131 RepID=A0A6I5N287_9BIFI|nr:ADP-ribosylglycohydrolase family protein [Bifidobacterium choloepi]NEG69759.1 ADP-ribosylglycohydrolase [Bifidobacterium choloepi]
MRARGALTGLALGDALGMPTQSMSPAQIDQYYGGPVTKLMDAVPEQPIAPNMPAGSVTDDTEQAFVLANRLINDNKTLISDETDVHARLDAPAAVIDTGGLAMPPRPRLDNDRYAKDLLVWEAAMKARGSLDLLGPSTKAALQALTEGVPIDETGRYGTTNGGAMRAAPIGIAFSMKAPDRLLAKMAQESCLVTHNTTQGIEATTLVAAAVSLGMGGDDDPLAHALEYVAGLPGRGYWSPKASVLARTRYFLEWSRSSAATALDDDQFAAALRVDCGTSVEANESVPAAFATAARFMTNPTRALCFAASLGGDTDTIAAITGAILGAQYGPDAFCEDKRVPVVTRLKDINRLDIDSTAIGLVRLRLATMQ